MEKMATDNRGLNARQAILQGSTFVLSMYICSKLGICTFYPCPASSPKPLAVSFKQHNMSFTTFLFGAGASASAIPTIKDLPISFEMVSDYIHEEIAKHKNGQTQHFNSIDDKELVKISNNIRKLSEVSKEYGTVDTYFKKLYLNKEVEETKELKSALSFFFYLWQHCCTNFKKSNSYEEWKDIDLRYISLLATILQEENGRPKWNSQFKIITWNYDFQIISALAKFVQSNDKEIIKEFSIYPFNNLIDKQDVEANIVYLNGISGAYDFQGSIDSRFRKNLCNPIENIFEICEDFNTQSEKNPNKEYLNFAWDFNDNVISRQTVAKAQEIMKLTKQLVIVGYSFPYFNFDVDKLLFGNLKNGCKIVYQDFDADEEPIKNRTNKLYNFDIKVVTSEKIMNQFIIPQT